MQPALLYHDCHTCFSFFCCKTHTQKTWSQRQRPTASTHLIICLPLSLHFPIFSSIRLSSFHCRFGLIHHLVSQSLNPTPSLYSCFFLSLPMIPSGFGASVCLFLLSLSFLNSVVSCLLSSIEIFFCCCCCRCRMLCFVFVALLQCHPAGRPPHWLLLEGAEHWTSVCMNSVNVHVWSPLLGPSV